MASKASYAVTDDQHSVVIDTPGRFTVQALRFASDSTYHHVMLPSDYADPPASFDPLLFILPLLIVLSTFLFILLIFLLCVIFRKRRGITLRDSDGPTDMSHEEYIDSEGGFEGVESRWLESVAEPTRAAYLRARGILHPSPIKPPLSRTSCSLPTPVSTQFSTN